MVKTVPFTSGSCHKHQIIIKVIYLEFSLGGVKSYTRALQFRDRIYPLPKFPRQLGWLKWTYRIIWESVPTRNFMYVSLPVRNILKYALQGGHLADLEWNYTGNLFTFILLTSLLLNDSSIKKMLLPKTSVLSWHFLQQLKTFHHSRITDRFHLVDKTPVTIT